jgi:hypothetical protein
MTDRLLPTALVAGAIGYLVAVAVAMTTVSYDLWGAMLLVPIYGVIGAFLLRRLFAATPTIGTVLVWGLPIKAVGAIARYYVGFEAYEGGIDAARYHDYATSLVASIRAGELSWLRLVPSGEIGTPFMEDVTAIVYAVTGGSQLAGFMTFSFLAYLGMALMVKAAVVAVPGLAARRYAVMCVLFPSLVYWPSSIGKETVMAFSLGVAAYGIALIYSRNHWVGPLMLVAGGMALGAAIRPHVVGIWLAGAFPGLLVALFRGTRTDTRGGRRPSRLALMPVIAIAAIAVGAASIAAVEYLQPDSDEEISGSITSILDETQRRTAQAGSQFTPPSVASPANWPFAVVRTLTRPLPHEVNGLAQMLTGAEMAVLLGIYVISWRRLVHAPLLGLRVPYVAFALTTLFLSGLAYSSFANLAVLTRQKSLVFPFLLLLACLPTRREAQEAVAPTTRDSVKRRRALDAAVDLEILARAGRQPALAGPMGGPYGTSAELRAASNEFARANDDSGQSSTSVRSRPPDRSNPLDSAPRRLPPPVTGADDLWS